MDDFDAAVESFRTGAYADAIRSFSLVPDSSHLRGRALIGIGRAQYLLGDYLGAASSFDSAMVLAGDRAADALMYKAIALADLGQFSEALRTIDEAMAVGPQRADQLYNRGQIFMRMGRFLEAEGDFMVTVAAAPGNDRNLTYAALAAAEGGFLERAIDRCQAVIFRNPQSSMALNVLSIAEARLGRLSDSLSHVTMAIEIWPSEANFYYNRGCTFRALKDLPKAIADFSRAIELRPGYAKAFTNRGNCCLGIEDVTGAIADFSTAISLGDTISYFSRANVYVNRGNLNAALADFDRSIQHHPKHRDSYIGRSLVNRELGLEQDSVRDYETAVRIIRDIKKGEYEASARVTA